MKKLFIGLLVGLWFVGTASAATVSTTLSVSATVGGTCSVSTTPVAFSGYDGTIDVLGEGSVSVTCPEGIPYDITMDAGLNLGMNATYPEYRALSDGRGIYLAYGLGDPSLNEWGDAGYADTYPAGLPVAGVGLGVEETFVVNAGISNYGGPVPAGTYTDIVNVTVNF